MFLPTTKKELVLLGWEKADIILISGDTYIDSPFTGIAVIGKILVKYGFRVGIIAQPDMDSDLDIKRLGEPELFWGISAGAVDSMVANYTASKKWRKSDNYTPGGINNRRPDRAVIAYTNLVKKYFKDTCPIVLGGIEASLRRICHYDFWTDKIRRSILFDAKADYLVYGMAENTILQLAKILQETDNKQNKIFSPQDKISKIRGICYISKVKPYNYKEVPGFNDVSKDKKKFIESFHIFYNNNDPFTATGLVQKQDSRFLIQNPPCFYPDTNEMDKLCNLEFERDVHPFYKINGKVKALDTIQFSILTHRGCYGECNFCAIAVHEGRTVRWRSAASILKEVQSITDHPGFKGIISDAGGPTANMYGYECSKKLKTGACRDKRCLFPSVCNSLKPDHSKLTHLLKKISYAKGVKKIFTNSGIRYDLIFQDKNYGDAYFTRIVSRHVSGQMKIAPEHSEKKILDLMGKPGTDMLCKFKKKFDSLSKQVNKKQFLTYYFIAAHPGCTMNDMEALKKFTREKLKLKPEQVQIFTPTPSTYSTLMYYTGINPFTGEKLFVEKITGIKEKQKHKIIGTKLKQKKFRERNKKIGKK